VTDDKSLTGAGLEAAAGAPESSALRANPDLAVALLTGGGDRPYAFGLATELISKGVSLDIIGSDDLDFPEFHGKAGVRFLNLRGNQRSDASVLTKASRVLAYYVKLLRYAASAKPKIFHILWNNKFELFDRTLLMLYYMILRKKVVLTAHNVNARKRDSRDSVVNRATLRAQYKLADHIFVHTDQMRQDLAHEFGIRGERVTVIPFGINNSIPETPLTTTQARERLGIREDAKTLLFFGNITPYKGLEYLVEAFRRIEPSSEYRLIIAGRPKGSEKYWVSIREKIQSEFREDQILLRGEFIPDEETEVYFKAADVLVLPYTQVYQSGVLFLGYSFGLPVLAADVGSLRDEIVEGKTGFLFKPADAEDLARVIRRYFASDVFTNLRNHGVEIRAFAAEHHSWDVVGQTTTAVYSGLLLPASRGREDRETSSASLHVKTPS